MVESEHFVSSIRRRVGWFVIVGIGTLLLLLLLITIRTDLFSKEFDVYFSPPSASSFYEGQPVKFQGFAIGHVDEIELEAKGKVKVTLQLLDRYREMIRVGSIARLTKEGLIGEQVVEVSAGDEEMSIIADGDMLEYETEASFEQLLLDLKPAVGNANILFREMAALAVWMNDPYGDVRVAMSGLREVTKGVRGGELEEMITQFTAMLKQLQQFAKGLNQQQIAKELSNSLKIMAKVLSDIEPFSETVGREGPATIKHMNALLNSVDQLSGSLNVIASDLSELTPELPALVRESQATVKEMNNLLKRLQNSWLVGGGGSRVEMEDDGVVAAPPVLNLRP